MHCRLPPALPTCCLLLALASATAQGGNWRQGWGLVGNPPSAAAAGAALQLAPLHRGGQLQVWVQYRGAGPLQVRLHGAGPGAAPERMLPAPGRYLLATLPAGDARHLRLDAVPGPVRRPQPVPSLLLPFDPVAGVRVHQAAHGHASHQDRQNRHAWDFALPEGTPVLAARAGQVIALHEDSTGPGTAPGDGGNWIRVLHEDGSMAVYAHLQPGSRQVQLGQRVGTGQPLAASGNTGYSTAPHLHFVVQVNTGMALASIPAEVNGPHGILRAPGSTAGSPL